LLLISTSAPPALRAESRNQKHAAFACRGVVSAFCFLLFAFPKGKQLAALRLQPGDLVQLAARVTTYTKGYKGRREDVWKPVETDYRLSYPTNVRKVV
jgi:hypothetical protein